MVHTAGACKAFKPFYKHGLKTASISCFEASDSITNLHRALDRFKEEIADINGMSWRGYTMRPFICGDYEFLSGIYGLSGDDDSNHYTCTTVTFWDRCLQPSYSPDRNYNWLQCVICEL
ncbi:hypothetical protein EMCRGX_G017667 [Ephydatia muelleri]